MSSSSYWRCLDVSFLNLLYSEFLHLCFLCYISKACVHFPRDVQLSCRDDLKMRSLSKWVAWDLQTTLVSTFYSRCEINYSISWEVLRFSVIIA